MHHHFRSLGGWTFAFKDYTDLNITGYVDDPRMQDLGKIVDPYCKSAVCGSGEFEVHVYIYISFLAYLDRLTMPKLLINSGGDEFFLPDDNHYFWDDLPGEKFLRCKKSGKLTSKYIWAFWYHLIGIYCYNLVYINLIYLNLWFIDEISDNYCRIMPNAEHSCAGHYTTIILGIRAFYLSLLMVRHISVSSSCIPDHMHANLYISHRTSLDLKWPGRWRL